MYYTLGNYQKRMIGLVSIFLLHLTTTSATSNSNQNLETYIVQVEPNYEYQSFLPTDVLSTSTAAITHSYENVFSGFAAKLSKADLEFVKSRNGFVSAHRERTYPLHTTHSPKFLGLFRNLGFWNGSSKHGKGVVIGLLDSGISPSHPSFNDAGMPPPPLHWKGKCDFAIADCSNKVIGAQSFVIGETIPFDEEGHGTHTASTAAGGFVENANIFGNANGTAVGVAPLAHIAIYKVCHVFCFESHILAGMDSAIADGVDVLSVSIGGESSPFYSNPFSIAAYSAMEKGIFVSCSAGNDGPKKESMSYEAPWILTVGASTTDRKLIATVVLGNNEQLDGQSAFQPKNFSASSMLPLVFPGAKNTSDIDALFLEEDSLKNIDIQGKIVVCLYGSDEMIAKKAGAAAVILINEEHQGYTTIANAYVLPVAHISYADGLKLRAYLNSTSTPTAKIVFKGTSIGDDNKAPVVAEFSSRGPSRASPGILKPDIIGPGVNILAAWHVSIENYTNSKSTFNMISGTSMACPHLSGIAALLKSEHPDWSPAAIKSAIMTTADVVNRGHSPIEDERFLPANIFATGAGHVNPSRASHPGLIYDLQPQDYIPYLCGLNYTDQQVGSILRRRVNCSEEASIPQAELNYPSFSLTFSPHSTCQAYTRTATNVGEHNSSYTVEIVSPPGIDVLVQPTSLNFSEANKKIKYRVEFIRLKSAINNTVVQGHLKWISTKHSVRSPIVVMLH